MPTYVYKCNQCGQEFEKVTRIADKDKVNCVKCEGPVTRMLTSFNVVGGGKKPAAAAGPGCFGAAPGACPHQGGGG